MELLQVDDAVASSLIQSDLDHGKVEFWTTLRLPFEPKGAIKEARDLLRKQLDRLVAVPGTWLDATYASRCTDFVDTENVLLFNVGAAALSSASQFGLRFKREFSDPPACPLSGPNWRHYHRYELVPTQRAEFFATPEIANMQFDLPRLSASLKPHDYWWPAKTALAKADEHFESLRGNFSTSIHILGPKYRGNVAALVKPLFDGIISALHWDPDFASTDSACELLATRLNTTRAQIAEALQTRRNSILGRRKVVAPYRKFVKWNPADEACAVGQLQFTNRDSAGWRINVAFATIS